MIGTRVTCPDDPRVIDSDLMCLYAVSKDLRGELRLEESEVEKCPQSGCTTLKTRHLLLLEVIAHRDCDSEQASVLDGRLQSKDLTSAFIDGSGDNRGFHAANFVWRGSGVVVTGRLSGVTNAGVHREPAGRDCQKCNEHGVMEGRLCGQIRRGPSELLGCNVIGVYLLRFDAGANGGEGAVEGTFEGVVVCGCD